MSNMDTSASASVERPLRGRLPVRDKLPGIRNIVAVASGKGGVGKSTVSVNLALALHAGGAPTGIVDADILGPSIPTMLGIPRGEPPTVTRSGLAIPVERHGLKIISMGMLTPDDAPAILRGPMVTKYLQVFVGGVAWGKLEHLILDLPPGTGDVQLTLAQQTPLSGAIVVTTPQDVSLNIARRGLRMFEKVQVPILGVVENMGSFDCPHCGKATDIFRSGGGARMAKELGVPFLGSIPLDPAIVESGDEGRPIVVDHPDSPASRAYFDIARALLQQIEKATPSALAPFEWDWESGHGAPPWLDDLTSTDHPRTLPLGLRKKDARTLSILWADGRAFDYDLRDLRLACCCAACIEEMSGRKVLDPKSVRPDVTPRRLSTVGNYAVNVKWNDGHSSGIYSFEMLRALGDALRPAAFDV